MELAVVVVGELPALPADLVVRAGTSPGGAVPAVRAAAPDVVLVHLDGPAATAAVGALAAALPDVPVVVVAEGPEQVLDVVRAGATGYVLRGDPALPQIVRAAAAGGTAFGDGLAAHVLDAAATAGAAPTAPALTDREAEVLRLVVEGLTAKQIATRLVLSPRTVENHVQRILRKFDVPGRAALVRFAIENGLA